MARSFIRIEFKHKSGPTPLQLLKNIPVIQGKIEESLGIIAVEARAYIVQLIATSVKRQGSTGKLARSIRVHSLGSKESPEFGIGSVIEMNNEARYWAIINWGGMVTKRLVPGYFGNGTAPGRNAMGNEAFTYTPNQEKATFYRGGEAYGGGGAGKRTFMQIKKPIRPMHYIERTQAWLRASFEPKIVSKLNQIKLGSF